MKTYILNTIEAIKEHLDEMSVSELVQAHNTYCQNANMCDDEIHNNDEDFFSTYFENDVIGAVRAASYGDFNFSHDFVMFNGYANLQSFNNPSEYIDLTAIAEDIMENAEDYNIELEEVEEEEEN